MNSRSTRSVVTSVVPSSSMRARSTRPHGSDQRTGSPRLSHICSRTSYQACRSTGEPVPGVSARSSTPGFTGVYAQSPARSGRQRVGRRQKLFLRGEFGVVVGGGCPLHVEPPNDAVSIDQEFSDGLVPGAFPIVYVAGSWLEAVEPTQRLCRLPERQGFRKLAGGIDALSAYDFPRRLDPRESIRSMSNEGGVNGDGPAGRMVSIIEARVVQGRADDRKCLDPERPKAIADPSKVLRPCVGRTHNRPRGTGQGVEQSFRGNQRVKPAAPPAAPSSVRSLVPARL